MMDVALPGTRPTASPHVAEFVGRVLRRLKPLTSEAEIHNHVHEENTQETDERTQAVKLLKTGQSRARVGGGGATERKKNGAKRKSFEAAIDFSCTLTTRCCLQTDSVSYSHLIKTLL